MSLADFTLIVVTGPTGSGKTDLAIKLAQHLGCHIISADSRQIYRDIPIGTAAPSPEQLALVPHHFVGTLPLEAYYSASEFETDVLSLINMLSATANYAVMCGGSMMYIDAVVRGIDEMPTVTAEVRTQAYRILEEGGIEAVKQQLSHFDPHYLATAPDLQNAKRLVHALEVSMQAGVPYSSLCTGRIANRPFKIVQVAIDLPREVLFDRINRRVEAMMQQGLEQEARAVYPMRHLNSLNTVGYKEMFAWFDGVMDRDTAIARLAKNTRVYAKKQLTWLKKRPDVKMLPAESAFADTLALLGI